MVVNFAWRKYNLLVRKIGHDEALKRLTKKEFNSIYEHMLNQSIIDKEKVRESL